MRNKSTKLYFSFLVSRFSSIPHPPLRVLPAFENFFVTIVVLPELRDLFSGHNVHEGNTKRTMKEVHFFCALCEKTQRALRYLCHGIAKGAKRYAKNTKRLKKKIGYVKLLQHLVDGKSYKKAAGAMLISFETVKSYIPMSDVRCLMSDIGCEIVNRTP